MSWKGFRSGGNGSSRLQSVMPRVGYKKDYGAYRNKRAKPEAEEWVIRWNQDRPSKHLITLPDRPFDHHGGDQ